jgi:hypothetical protein
MVDRSVWQPNGGRASLPGAVKYAGTREICNESAVLEIGIMQQIGLIRLGRGHDNVIGVPRTLLDVANKLAVEDDIHQKETAVAGIRLLRLHYVVQRMDWRNVVAGGQSSLNPTQRSTTKFDARL